MERMKPYLFVIKFHSGTIVKKKTTLVVSPYGKRPQTPSKQISHYINHLEDTEPNYIALLIIKLLVENQHGYIC